MKVIPGGVTQPQGFLANGISAGIKWSGKPDLSLIYSPSPSTAVGVFTQNSVKAAPLLVTQKHLIHNRAQAIITNSGNANCFTGKKGLKHARQTTELIARLLNLKVYEVLVASTGIIGKPLPYKKIAAAAPKLVQGLSPTGGNKAAEAIITTDKVIKQIAVQVSIGGKVVTIGGCAKGSGMIQPDMATMLAFITTDAAISVKMLKIALKRAVEKSFNRITVDGCMSTNDMVTVQANGLAKNLKIVDETEDFKKFYAALEFVCLDLAKKIILDGEGATKFIEIAVNGAVSERQAKTIAMTIANSPLVKTAAYGSNPNWGRVAAAVGSLGLNVTEKDLKIRFSSFEKKDIRIVVDLKLGAAKAAVYTCDLSVGYVKINGAYN